MANLSNINNILRTNSTGVGIFDDAGTYPLEISSATTAGMRLINTAAAKYDVYANASEEFIITKVTVGERLSISSGGAITFNDAYTFPTDVTTTNNYVLTAQTDGTTAWAAEGSTGTVTSIATTSPIEGGTITGSGTITHAAQTDTETTSSETLAHDGTFTAYTSVTTNATGHVSAHTLKTYTLPSAGGMEDWIIAGDTGTTTITDGDTVTIAGGTNVTTSESAGTVTINSTDQYVGTLTQIDMPNTGPGEGGILVTNGTGPVVDIGIEYIGGDNIISTAWAGSGTVPTDAHILWADTATVTPALRKVFYSPVSDLPFASSGASGTVTSVSGGDGITVSGATTVTPVVSVDYTTTLSANLISSALSSTITVPDDDEILILKSSGSSINTVERTKVSKLNFTNNTGTLTAVTGTAPVVSSGGTTPAISMAAATGSVNGYLTSADWTTFNNKTSNSGTVTSVGYTHAGNAFTVGGQPVTSSGTIAVTMAGTTAQYIRGDGSLATYSGGSGTVTSITLAADSGSGSAITTSGTFTFTGGTNVTTSVSGTTVTINSTDQYTGTVTNIAAGIGLDTASGSAITSTGTILVDYGPGTGNIITLSTAGAAGGTDIDEAADYFMWSDTAATKTVKHSLIQDLPFTNNAGTVTSVAALTLGTTGTDLSSTVTGGTGAAIITLQVPSASAANRGALTAADWTTFNNKTGNLGTVTSVAGSAGTGISISGSPITSSGTLTITNTGVTSIVAGTNISISGATGAVTVNSTDQYTGTVSGTGTATRVAFWSASDTLSSNANLYWDNVNSRLGIGTDTPDELLHLYKASGNTGLEIEAVSGGDPIIRFVSANNRTGDIFYTDATTLAKFSYDHTAQAFKTYAHNNTTVDFYVSETEAYFPSQDVGIGTTAPSSLLHLKKTTDAFQALIIETTASAPTSNSVGSKFINSSGSLYMFIDNSAGDYGPTGGTGAGSAYAGNFRLTGAYPLQFATSDTLRMTIDSSGNVQFAAYGAGTLVTDASGNITASSDSSLKTRVYEKISGLDEVLELQPKAYYWNKDEKKNIEFGFFADEVKDVIPEAAPLHKDGTYGLLDRGIIAALVNSIQELKAEIEELKNKPCICDKCNCK